MNGFPSEFKIRSWLFLGAKFAIGIEWLGGSSSTFMFLDSHDVRKSSREAVLAFRSPSKAASSESGIL
jgi:hypothetical protein